MALKDLVVDRAALTEQAIENIVKTRAMYDATSREIVLAPSMHDMGPAQKILLYLVANLGWPFLDPTLLPLPAKPGDLERALGIPGGTVRRVLPELRSQRLVRSDDQANYEIQIANIEAVRRVIEGSEKPMAPRRTSTGNRTQPVNEVRQKVDGVAQKKTPGKRPSGKLRSIIQELIDDGFFDQKRSVAHVSDRYRELGNMSPSRTISLQLLRAVRAKHLARHSTQGGKGGWEYQKAKP